MTSEKKNGESFDWKAFRISLRRLGIWIALLGILWILRDFFPLIFLTFIFAYIMNTMSGATERFLPNHRRTRVVMVFIVFLGMWVGAGWFLVPRIKEQGEQAYESAKAYYEKIKDRQEKKPDETTLSLVVQDLPESLQNLFGPTLRSEAAEKEFEKQAEKVVLEYLPRFFQAFVFFILQTGTIFLLATLFSFLILLDLPRLMQEVRKLKRTRLKDVFETTAPSIAALGRIIGKTFQAQAVIAICNTILTAIGLWILGIPQISFLSFIVFLFSFVPVAGVFISSVPICLIALGESGIQLVLMAILLITIIHMIEAYILNPRIYGAALHMNPVLVLAVLTIAGKLVGPWGFLLGVPVCYYFFAQAIWDTSHDKKSTQEASPA